MSELQTNIDNDQVKAGKAGFLNRITGIVFSPGKVMDNLALKPRVLFPILLMVLTPALFVLSRLSLFKQYLRENMELGLRQQNMQVPADQMDMILGVYSVALPIALPIFLLLAWLVLSLILMGIFKLFKGEGKYKHYLSVTGYALIIPMLSFALMLILSFFNGNLLTELSPSLFINEINGNYWLGFLKGILSSIDIFSIWYLAVVGIGIKAVSSIKGRKVYYILFGLYFIISILSAFASASALAAM